MTAPATPGAAQLADATRTAIAMCAASDRGDVEGWVTLLAGTSPGVLIAAFTGVSRFLADRLASSFVVPVEDLYVMILAELGKGA